MSASHTVPAAAPEPVLAINWLPWRTPNPVPLDITADRLCPGDQFSHPSLRDWTTVVQVEVFPDGHVEVLPAAAGVAMAKIALPAGDPVRVHGVVQYVGHRLD